MEETSGKVDSDRLRLHKCLLNINFSSILPDTAHKFLTTARGPHITVRSRLNKRRHDTAMTCN